MKSNENILLICNCHTLYSSTFLLSDVTKIINNKTQKIQCTSKTKIAVITQQKIHVFNSIIQTDNQDVSKKSQSVVKSTFYDIIHQSIFSLIYFDKIPILVQDKEKIEKILKSEQRPLHKFNPFGVVLLNQQNKVILFKSLWIFFLSKVSTEPRSKEIKKYIDECDLRKKTPNKNFIKIMCEIITKQDFTFPIDPLILSKVSGFDQQNLNEGEEMRELFHLTSSLQFRRAQMMFELMNDQIIELGLQFLTINNNKLESISFKNCKLSDQGFKLMVNHIGMIYKLLEINFSGNNFTDEVLESLGKMIFKLPRLNKLHLDKNKIRFNNPKHIYNFIKAMDQDFQLSLQHNQINDESTDLIISLIILAEFTPIRILNLSYNKFSMFGVYKIIMSSVEVPMIVYAFPIPLNPELLRIKKIFQKEKHQQVKLLEFEDKKESIQQKDHQKIIQQNIKRQRIVIKITRKKYTKKNLPCSLKQKQIAKKNVQHINTAIDENIPIQKLLELCQYINNFQFEMPMTLMKNLYQYIWQKYNEALLIRVCFYNQDHYSIQFIKNCCPFIGINLSHFQSREEKVQERKNIILNKIHKLLNLQYNDNEFNQQLEEIIKESLRLDLRGQAIQMLYVLKIRRDEIIHQLIQSSYGFEQIQYEGKELDLNQMLKQAKQQLTYPPQLLKLQLDCNWYKKWYFVDWKQIIKFSKQNENVLKQSVVKLSENQSMQQFTYLILDRFRFLKNDFFQYDRKLWLGLYNQKMINIARLYHLSGDAQYNSHFLQLNLKVLIHPYTILNLNQIKQKVCNYRIQNYEYLVKNKNNYYGLMDKLSNFKSQPANKQFAELMNILKELFKQVKKNSSINFYILIIALIKFIRNAVFVDFLIEELYLHLLFFTKQKYPDLLTGIIPVLTHYLPLPKMITKQVLNFVIEMLPLNLKAVQFTYNQKLLEKNVTRHSKIENIVYRDWIPRIKELPSLVKNYMKFSLKIKTPSISFTISVLDSNLISQVVTMLRNDEHFQNILDLSYFWLFDSKQFDDEPLFPKDYIGQVVSRWSDNDPNYLIFKRRIYSPFYQLQLQVMNDDDLSEIFNSTKRQFLLGKYKTTKIHQLCSIVHYCNFKEKVKSQQNVSNLLIEDLNKNIEDWMPRNILNCIEKKENLKKETKLNVMELNFFNSNIKQLKILMLKKLLIGTSLYIINPQEMKVIGVNFWAVYLFSDSYLEIPLNHILSIITKAKGLQIRYFTFQKEQEIQVEMNERIAYFFYQDFISYVDMRLKYPISIALKIIYKEVDNEQQRQSLMGLGTVILKSHQIFDREEHWVKRTRMRNQRLQKWFEIETEQNKQEIQKLIVKIQPSEQVVKEEIHQGIQVQKVQNLMFQTSNQLDEALKLFKFSKQEKKKEVDEEEHPNPFTIQQIIQQQQESNAESDIIKHFSLSRRTLNKR